MKLRSRHLLGIAPLEPDEISLILDTAEGFAPIASREIKKVPTLRGKTVVNFFVEPILATHDRQRFEIVCYSDVAVEDDVHGRAGIVVLEEVVVAARVAQGGAAIGAVVSRGDRQVERVDLDDGASGVVVDGGGD